MPTSTWVLTFRTPTSPFKLGNQPGMATSYGQLGLLAQARGLLEEAEGWLMKALAIFEALGDEPNKAKTLGNLARLKAAQGEAPPPQ